MTVYRDREDDDVAVAISERAARHRIARQFKRAEHRHNEVDLDRFGAFETEFADGTYTIVHDTKNLDAWLASTVTLDW